MIVRLCLAHTFVGRHSLSLFHSLMLMTRLLLILTLFCLPLVSWGQMAGHPWITWEEFVAEYTDLVQETEEEPLLNETLDRLEQLTATPLQLNRATRSDLLLLPFLSEAQVDSLIAYRKAKRGLKALGELQLVSGMDYFTRRYLSLFTRCDSTLSADELPATYRPVTPSLAKRLCTGRHEMETRLDVPLYRRQGYRTPAEPTATNYYTGNALHHIVRYRYQYRREVAYGLTMEKDAGEPVAKAGFYPYDYLSGYLLVRTVDRPWAFVAGDYEVTGGRGLLFGRTFYTNRNIAGGALRTQPLRFKAHTSSEEVRFFRGAAFSYVHRRFEAMAFVSYRRLDARLVNDTVRTLLTTGLHRTLSEIDRRRTVGCFTTGAHLGYTIKHLMLNLDGYATRYDHYVSPDERAYNSYVFRGQTAGGVSFSYAWQLQRWTLTGELAADHQFHLATEHAVGYRPSSRLQMGAQLRLLPARFVSRYGDALQQGSSVRNEEGVLLSVRYLPIRSLELTGYADFFRYPQPTYTTALPSAKGLETQLQARWELANDRIFTLRYRFKARQRNVTGYKLMEYRQTHRLRLAASLTQGKAVFTPQLDLSLATRQTGRQSFGWMPSLRMAFATSKSLSLKGFATVFFTDDYESALYAYEPRLYRAAGFDAFAYHGARLSALADWRLVSRLILSLRLGCTRFFNRSEQSSGIAAIHSPWKSDLSLQVRWRIGS